jgi:hypothetical protein
MRAKLKGLHSPDIVDLISWSPGDDDFGFLLQIMIGPSDTEGFESFDVMVCTPRWFEEQLKGQKIRSGEHTLFMDSYDYCALVNYIEKRVHSFEAVDWQGLVAKLSSLGRWEFADYAKAR